MGKLKVKDILNMDINDFMSYNIKQMREVVQTLASAANKRLKDFRNKGLESPATKYVEKTGGKFSTKGKDLNALRNEFARVKGFMTSETGTVRGFRNVQRETIKELKQRGVDITPDQWNKFWKIYEKLKETDPSVSERSFKYTGMREIIDTMKDSDDSVDHIVSIVISRMERLYTEQEEKRGKGISGFFTIR